MADLTYVRTHRGWIYAAFVIDVFSRMVVGWRISESLRSDPAIDAREMAVWNRTRNGQVLDGLAYHSDRGVYLSIRYSERLDENDIVASVGSRGDSYDSAMAEAFNSLFKWELDLSPGTLAGPRRRRVRPPWATSIGSTTAGSTARSPRTTLRHAGRVRSDLLPSNTTHRRGGYPKPEQSWNPGRFSTGELNDVGKVPAQIDHLFEMARDTLGSAP